jgi:hypothetical protein
MDRLALFVFLCMLSVGAIAQTEPPQTPSQSEREHTAWIAGALDSMQTIKGRHVPVGPCEAVHD